MAIIIFFQIESHLKMDDLTAVVRCYGITKDPETNNFMMVMEYAWNGSLRQHLNNKFNELKLGNKLFILRDTAFGLANIHDRNLTHRDFHCGNILSTSTEYT